MAGAPGATQWILDECKRQGFALAGVCEAAPPTRQGEFRSWLDAGKHGEMGYLEEQYESWCDPNSVWDGAQSVVMVADVYATRDDGADEIDPKRGRLARYARGKDYHRVMKQRLHHVCDAARVKWPGQAFRSFVDTVPINERELATQAGLGWFAKHTLVINPRLGSWMLLGGFLTTLKLRPLPDQPVYDDHCGSCTRCIDACPTKAISPYSVNARKCISYLTIEHDSEIDPHLAQNMGDWIAGCDICQEVCPHNSPRPGMIGEEPRASYRSGASSFDLLEVLNWDKDARQEALRTSPLKRIKLEQFRRNAAIAAGHALQEHELPDLRAKLEEIASNESEPDQLRRAAQAGIDAS